MDEGLKSGAEQAGWEAPETGGQTDSKHDSYLRERDRQKETADASRREVGETQAARFETSFYGLMRRSNDSQELAQALDALVGALEYQSASGGVGEMSPESVGQLAQLVKEKAQEIHGLGRRTS